MRKSMKVIAALCCAGVSMLAHADFRTDFVKRFPAAEGAKIAPAFSGFWSVVKGDEVFFVNEDMSILISGNVTDLKAHRSLSDDLREANRPKLDVSQLDLRDAIKFGNGARRLFVFSDPDCPYCRRLDGELSRLKDVTVYLFPFPLAQLHPNAAGVSEAIWCQADRSAAWSKYQELARHAAEPRDLSKIGASSKSILSLQDQLMSDWHAYLHAHHAPEQPTCDNPIERNLALGQKWNIFGTPALIFEDGTLIPGLTPVARIEAQLQKSASVIAGAAK